jgi:hypothetical protein
MERIALLLAGDRTSFVPLDPAIWQAVLKSHGHELRGWLSEAGRQQYDRAIAGDGVMSLSSGDSDLENRNDLLLFLEWFWAWMPGWMRPPLSADIGGRDPERRFPQRDPCTMLVNLFPPAPVPRAKVDYGEVVADLNFAEEFPWDGFYFHWMVQLLPRLKVLKESGRHFDRLNVPVTKPWQRETLQAVLENLGIDVPVNSGSYQGRRVIPSMACSYCLPCHSY